MLKPQSLYKIYKNDKEKTVLKLFLGIVGVFFIGGGFEISGAIIGMAVALILFIQHEIYRWIPYWISEWRLRRRMGKVRYKYFKAEQKRKRMEEEDQKKSQDTSNTDF